jgi:hypothetical protein
MGNAEREGVLRMRTPFPSNKPLNPTGNRTPS